MIALLFTLSFADETPTPPAEVPADEAAPAEVPSTDEEASDLPVESSETSDLPVELPTSALWAGRMAVFGERKLPFIGTVEFRNDNYTLADVVVGEDGVITMKQRVCRVAFEKVAGAQASMSETAPRSMPIATPTFRPAADGSLAAEAWPSGWDDSDHDDDGFPGIAVHVSATLCGGTMHFASDASTVASAVAHEGGIKGLASIRVAQQVAKVQGVCLSMVTRDVTQDLRGHFVYVPVPEGTTCDTAGDEAWPDPMALDLSAITAPELPVLE